MEKSFYKSSRWKSKRERILRRDEYMCRECKRFGKSVLAATVHHIIPLEQRPDLKLTSDNLLSLCSKCHDKMHDRTNNQLTKLGEEWVHRISIRYLYLMLIFFIQYYYLILSPPHLFLI